MKHHQPTEVYPQYHKFGDYEPKPTGQEQHFKKEVFIFKSDRI